MLKYSSVVEQAVKVSTEHVVYRLKHGRYPPTEVHGRNHMPGCEISHFVEMDPAMEQQMQHVYFPTAARPQPARPMTHRGFTVADYAMHNERARRALSYGGGIDGILFLLALGAAIVMVMGLLIFGLNAAELNAERDAEISPSTLSTNTSEIGTN